MQIYAEIYHTNLAQIYSRTSGYRINMNLISVAGRQEISLTLITLTVLGVLQPLAGADVAVRLINISPFEEFNYLCHVTITQ